MCERLCLHLRDLRRLRRHGLRGHCMRLRNGNGNGNGHCSGKGKKGLGQGGGVRHRLRVRVRGGAEQCSAGGGLLLLLAPFSLLLFLRPPVAVSARVNLTTHNQTHTTHKENTRKQTGQTSSVLMLMGELVLRALSRLKLRSMSLSENVKRRGTGRVRPNKQRKNITPARWQQIANAKQQNQRGPLLRASLTRAALDSWLCRGCDMVRPWCIMAFHAGSIGGVSASGLVTLPLSGPLLAADEVRRPRVSPSPSVSVSVSLSLSVSVCAGVLFAPGSESPSAHLAG